MTFIAILVFLTALLVVLRRFLPKLAHHDVTLLGFNLIFLIILMNMQALAFLAGFLAISYGFAKVACRWPKINAGFFIIPVIIIFAVFKKYEFLPLGLLSDRIPEILGLSYIVFRVLIIFFEARTMEKLPGPLAYVNYCISMFTFMSGPIQRYREFSEDLQQRHGFVLGRQDVMGALSRFMAGALKVIYLAPAMQGLQKFFMISGERGAMGAPPDSFLNFFYEPLAFSGALAPSLGFGFAALFYLIFLYFNFSGYTDMVIALARLVGFRLPENFNHPFSATSFLDFWTRWHISLSFWFRDYCFTPILKVMIKAGIKDAVIATLPAYFISFGLLGLWHGRTWPFILCGLMFAVASTANHCYRAILKQTLSKETHSKINKNTVYMSLTSALTLFYISLAITGFWLDTEALRAMWDSFSAGQIVLSFSIVTACLAACVYVVRMVGQSGEAGQFKERARPWVEKFNAPFYWGILVGICLWTLLLPKPVDNPFVYFGF